MKHLEALAIVLGFLLALGALAVFAGPGLLDYGAPLSVPHGYARPPGGPGHEEGPSP